MKKTVIFLVLLSAVFGYEVEDFKKGYVTAISSLNFSFQNDGVQPKKLNYIGKNIVYLDTTKLPTSEILFSQYLAHREGFKTNIIDGKLLLGAYDRLADAEEAQAKAKSLLNFTTKIIKNNKDEIWSKSPITEIVVKELVIDGIFVNKEVVYVNGALAPSSDTTTTAVKPAVVKKVAAAEPTRNFTLKNFQAQSYKLKENSDKLLSANYIELDTMSDGNYKTNTQTTTSDGETFVKVQDKNVYFLLKDVKFAK